MIVGRKYEPIREHRGWYYIEYRPAVQNNKYAWLNLVVLKDASKQRIIKAMEAESKKWLEQYPIPLFISAFDNKEDLYNLSSIKGNNHLVAFLDSNNKISLRWDKVNDEEIPNIALNQEYVDKLYANLHYKTYTELAIDRKQRRQQIQWGWFIVFIWLAVVPIVITTLTYYDAVLSLVAFLYSLYKAAEKALKLTGKWPKSKQEKAQELENQLKDHYYYHCERNPSGFEKLKLENFEKMAQDQIAKEANAALKTGKR